MVASAVSILPSSSAAQGTGGTITGIVTADAGQPVAGAQVLVPGRGIGTTTGPDGRFTLGRVPPGTYSLRAQRIGFAPQTQQVTVLADQTATVSFQLQQVATSLTTQVVVGYTTQQR